MSGTKLARILDAIAARAANITTANGCASNIGQNVRRDRRSPQALEDMPCVSVYLGDRLAGDAENQRANGEASVILLAYVEETSGTENAAIDVLADMQKTIEPGDNTLGGLLQGSRGGLAWRSDEIYLPDVGETVVAVKVTYAVPHIRKSGDPEIL